MSIIENATIQTNPPKQPDEMIILTITNGKNGKKCSYEFYFASSQPNNRLFLRTYIDIV